MIRQAVMRCGIRYRINTGDHATVQLRKWDKSGVLLSSSSFTPDEAREIGKALIECADHSGGES